MKVILLIGLLSCISGFSPTAPSLRSLKCSISQRMAPSTYRRYQEANDYQLSTQRFAQAQSISSSSTSKQKTGSNKVRRFWNPFGWLIAFISKIWHKLFRRKSKISKIAENEGKVRLAAAMKALSLELKSTVPDEITIENAEGGEEKLNITQMTVKDAFALEQKQKEIELAVAKKMVEKRLREMDEEARLATVTAPVTSDLTQTASKVSPVVEENPISPSSTTVSDPIPVIAPSPKDFGVSVSFPTITMPMISAAEFLNDLDRTFNDMLSNNQNNKAEPLPVPITDEAKKVLLSTFPDVSHPEKQDPLYLNHDTGPVDSFAVTVEDRETIRDIVVRPLSSLVVKSSSSKNVEEESEGGMKTMDRIKSAGVSGIIAYVATELGFWAVYPALILLYNSGAHAADVGSTAEVIADPNAAAKFVGFSAAFITVARFAVPLRVGMAFALIPFVEKNITKRFLPASSGETTTAGGVERKVKSLFNASFLQSTEDGNN
jgi:hypothetical protein